MINNEFRKQIRDMSNFTSIRQLPEFSVGVEHRAKKIISNIERRYR